MPTPPTQTEIAVNYTSEFIAYVDYTMSPRSEGGEAITASEGRRLREIALVVNAQVETLATIDEMCAQLRRRGPEAGWNQPMTRKLIDWQALVQRMFSDLWARVGLSRPAPPNLMRHVASGEEQKTGTG